MTEEQAKRLVEVVEAALTREALRAWLDRKPPPGSWRDFTDGDRNGPGRASAGDMSDETSQDRLMTRKEGDDAT